MTYRKARLSATHCAGRDRRPCRRTVGPVGVPVRATVRPWRELPEETASDRQQLRVHNSEQAGEPSRQFGADQARAGDTNTVQNFRRDCLRELTKLKTAWPDLHYRTVKGGLVLLPSPPAIAPSQLRLVE